MTTKKENDLQDRQLVITRLVNAPRELVWEAWTHPEHVRHWWGPDGFTHSIHEMEVRPGGVWRFMMHGPDGRDYPNKILFTEVVKPEKLMYDHSSGQENEPALFSTVVIFEDRGEKTFIRMTATFVRAEDLDRVVKENGAREGGKQHLRRLDEYTAAMEAAPFTLERRFNAPADKIWKALTEKDQMKQWYFDLPDFKPVVGFAFTFTGKGNTGAEYKHLCRVTEVVPGKKLSYSWQYEGLPGYSLLHFELFPEGESTRLTLTHRGLGSFAVNGPDFVKESFAGGWTELLGNYLKKFIEN